ncbi:hypothetical protein [Niveispirillum sp. BGYR6]|uniref:hypothetical protein n=1 Tax=Niveispirillum sp. BGYR6 TaxID=2971249 RepID=UPI0022B97D2C|nr:hypothetical protein [Niveispirillum sp. BGYR6]MDG5496707.1 hypothetical protein [Niveispirillum sp. BGYR6]
MTKRVLFPLVLAALAWCPPVLAEPPAKGDKKAEQPAEEEEIIVRGRRNGEPDYQEQYEFHQKEFERLHKIYGKEAPPNRRLDRMTDSPNPDAGKTVVPSVNGSTVQGQPNARPW